MFGLQRDHVRNQREHLIFLLANTHGRLSPRPESLNKLDDRAVDAVLEKLLKNYKMWCDFLGEPNNIMLPVCPQELLQQKILYMGLYLLIWGEAAFCHNVYATFFIRWQMNSMVYWQDISTLLMV